MKRPGGRPKEPEAAGKTQQVNVRVSPKTREALEAAADAAGVSLSREIERRLARSLDGDLEHQFGNLETYALCRLIAVTLKDVERETGRPFSQHPWSFKHARAAVIELLSYFAPIGEPAVPSDAPMLARLESHGLPPDVVASAKAQLETFQLGKRAASRAVFSVEASLENENGYRAQELIGIAAVLKAQLIAAGTAGNAQQDLIEDGPGATVKI
jgi:hypothetical protein